MPPLSRHCAVLLALLLAVHTNVHARTVYRCVQKGTVSLATAPEPGSKCEAKQIDDHVAKVPNLWGELGLIKGTLYERQQDGKTVYSTRKLPGSTRVMGFTVQTPKGSPAHVGLGKVGKPNMKTFNDQFKSAARRTGVDDAFLRSIAHAESGFDRMALSPKGAQGVMQLMPDVSRQYGVKDPYDSSTSIEAGAKHLKMLLRRYKGDVIRAAAAYNAGMGAVAKYGGVPPYAETRAYVDKVQALYSRYRTAMGRPLLVPERPAQ